VDQLDVLHAFTVTLGKKRAKVVKIRNIDLGDFPLLVAPMEDVSDPPFRALCKEYGADMMYTEFISSEGLIRQAGKSTKKLDLFEQERPVGIQIFGSEIESMKEATRIAEAANPDVIDINYGCPVKNVACKGAGAGILKDIPKMVSMTSEIVQSTNLPVTVKTRLGWDEQTKYIAEVAERLQDVGIEALSIHGRTRVQMYKGEADWSLIGQIKQNPRIRIPVFGNGDVNSPHVAEEKRQTYGVDGIMIGRAAIGQPWVFRDIKHYLKTGELLDPPGVSERVRVCKKHLADSIKWKGEREGVLEMRRHYQNYFRNYPSFKQFRTTLVQEYDPEALFQTLDEVADYYQTTAPA
jgi:nifR3 family TIM-barrel protein